MAKVEIAINYVAEWTNKSARVLVLQTKDKTISFPVIIAENEAFSLVKEIEQLKLKRPQTHDLLYNVLISFNIQINYVHIYNLIEGIFYTTMNCALDNQIVNIESRVSDAAILALKYNCPMFVEDFILEQVGISAEALEENNNEEESKDNLSNKSIKELEIILQEAVQNEDFESATLIRDEITRKNKM